MKQKRFVILSFLILLLFNSCNVIKYLKPGEELYTGATVSVSSTDNVNKKTIVKQMEEVLKPKPNQTIAGIRFKLWFYDIAGENPKKKTKKKCLRTSWVKSLCSLTR